VVHVSAIHHVFHKPVLLVGADPLVLTLHNLVERVLKVIFTRLHGHLLVQSGVELHDGVVGLSCLLTEQACSPDVVPVLRIVLEEPCIIIFGVHLWLAQQVGHLLRSCIRGLAVRALVHSHVPREKMLDHVRFGDWLRLLGHGLTLVLAEVKEWALVWGVGFERIKFRGLFVVRDVFAIEYIVVF